MDPELYEYVAEIDPYLSTRILSEPWMKSRKSAAKNPRRSQVD